MPDHLSEVRYVRGAATYAGEPYDYDGDRRRDGARWGPIVAGFVATMGAMIALTVLGLAVGMTVFEPGEELGTEAWIWGGAMALLSFLFGGWITGRTAGVFRADAAAINGFLTAAFALVAIAWLGTTGLSNLFGLVAANFDEIARVVGGTGQGDANLQQARTAFANAEEVAWGTLGALLLSFAAATFGAVLGHGSKPRNVEMRAEMGTEERQAA